MREQVCGEGTQVRDLDSDRSTKQAKAANYRLDGALCMHNRAQVPKQ